MSNPQHSLTHTDAHTETLAPPAVLSDRALTPKQEHFATLYASGLPAVDAYLTAYAALGSSRASARVAAHRLANTPRVAARIRELTDAAGALAVRSTRALVADLEDAAFADPNELVTLLNGACRHCWGIGGAYQWRDVAEYTAAVDGAAARGEPAPSFDGGTGYDFHRGANAECRACDGVGLNRVRFNSSQDVSPGARRLLRGIELHNDGSLKRLHLHDQMAMRSELHRLRGMHWERHVNVNVNTNAPSFENMTREQQHAFLEALRPAK